MGMIIRVSIEQSRYWKEVDDDDDDDHDNEDGCDDHDWIGCMNNMIGSIIINFRIIVWYANNQIYIDS
jgi:hypothetical protein